MRSNQQLKNEDRTISMETRTKGEGVSVRLCWFCLDNYIQKANYNISPSCKENSIYERRIYEKICDLAHRITGLNVARLPTETLLFSSFFTLLVHYSHKNFLQACDPGYSPLYIHLIQISKR